jgi:hypothetical protein
MQIMPLRDALNNELIPGFPDTVGALRNISSEFRLELIGKLGVCAPEHEKMQVKLLLGLVGIEVPGNLF